MFVFRFVTGCWIWRFASDFHAQFEESLQSDIGGERLHTLIRNPVFGTAFWAFHLVFFVVYEISHIVTLFRIVMPHITYLSANMVHKSLHARVHAE